MTDLDKDTALTTYFDNDGTNLVAENSEDAIKEINDKTTNLENNNDFRYIFETITTPASSISTYTNTTIYLDDWAEEHSTETNALVRATAGGRPTTQEVLDSTGAIVTATLLANGTYTLSGTPVVSDYALLWFVYGQVVDLEPIPVVKIIAGFNVKDLDLWLDDLTDVKLANARNIDLQDKSLKNLGHIDFSLDLSTAMQEGRLAYSDVEKTLIFGLAGGNVSYSLGAELYIPRQVENNSGVDIKNGDYIYISGGTGVNAEITLASSDNTATSDLTLAMATEDIDDGAKGFCTTFGIVRGETAQPIDTSGGAVGQQVFLGLNGKFTVTKPVAPKRVVCGGIIFRSHSTEGQILVNIEVDKLQMVLDITKDPTGFSTPEDVVITGDGTARTVTLSGTVEAYYRNIPNTTIINGWTSPAHSATTGTGYFLNYNGTDISWTEFTVLDPLAFYQNLLMAIAFYATDPVTPANSGWVYQRECHGFMQWQAHRQEHNTVGTYKPVGSGGTLADYIANSTTPADRRPSISSLIIYDEDNPTTLPALPTVPELPALPVDVYTQYYLSGADGTPNFVIDAADIVPLSGSQPYFNEFTGGAWQQTLVANNDYFVVFVVAIPMAADVNSQKIRFIFIQGQAEFGTLLEAQNYTSLNMTLGGLSGLTAETVFSTKIIGIYVGGNWRIISVEDLTGNKFLQVGSPTGTYLSSVTTDLTLTGLGTSASPLGIDLSNANTWTGIQTFSSKTQFTLGLDANDSVRIIGGDKALILDENGDGSGLYANFFCSLGSTTVQLQIDKNNGPASLLLAGRQGTNMTSFEVRALTHLFKGGHVNLREDNKELSVGADNDFHMRHDGVDSHLTNETGDLNITNESATGDIIKNLGDSLGITRDATLNLLGQAVRQALSNGTNIFGFEDQASVQTLYDADGNPIIILNTVGESSILGNMALYGRQRRGITEVAVDAYDIVNTDHIIHHNYSLTGTSDMTLRSNIPNNTIIHIHDVDGNASGNNITINTEGSETINGAATNVINVDNITRTYHKLNDNWYANNGS